MAERPRAGAGDRPGLSFGALALGVVGAAVGVLALTVLLVAVVPTGAKLVVALGGVLAAVATMAVVSRALTDRAIRREFDEDGSAARPVGGRDQDDQ